MATHTLSEGQRGAYAKTLVAAGVDKVELDRKAGKVEVLTDGTAAVYVTIDATDPTVAGPATYEIPAAPGPIAREISTGRLGGGGIEEVRLISAGTPKYSVSQS